MKEKKSIQLLLNKEKISELTNSNKQRILGGVTAYGGPCGGGGGDDTGTLCLYSCSCTIKGKGIC